MELTINEVRNLLMVMEQHPTATTVVDWTNRAINVLSEVKTHPTKRLSDGNLMQFQDYLYQIRG